MNWKEQVSILEKNEDFDVAIFFMEKVIKENPDNVDAYIFILFRLMYTIVEHGCYFSNISLSEVRGVKKQYYDAKEDHYELLAKKYFQECIEKFSDNAEFLYYVGFTAAMSEWYFGISMDDYRAMLDRAMLLEPNNLIYQHTYYIRLDEGIESNRQEAQDYARIILQNNSSIKEPLTQKGAVGEHWLHLATNWSKRMLDYNPN
jgi:hypothetical protein